MGLGEEHLGLATPALACAGLLEHRNALAQPARQSVARHLQRDHVRQFVPQRRRPVERAGRARLRGIHRDDAAEAGAEGANHPGQACGADREVVVTREDLDEDRALRRELIPRGEIGERLFGQRHQVWLQHRHLLLVEANGQVLAGHGDELVERVHQAQQVVGDRIERVLRERGIERLAGLGLVSGPQQGQAERSLGAAVLRIERDGLAQETDGLVEPVHAGHALADDARHVRVVCVQRQRLLREARDIGWTILDVRQGRRQRQGLDVPRIDGQHLLERGTGVGALARVHRLRGQQRPCVGLIGIDADRLSGRGLGRSRIAVGQRPRHADERRNVLRVGLQRRLVGRPGFGFVELLEKEIAPPGVDLRVVGREVGGGLEIRVGQTHLAQRLRRACRARQGRAGPLGLPRTEERLPDGRGFLASARARQEVGKRDGGFPAGLGRRSLRDRGARHPRSGRGVRRLGRSRRPAPRVCRPPGERLVELAGHQRRLPRRRDLGGHARLGLCRADAA